MNTALVIGGSGGIGIVTTERLLADHFSVCATYVGDAKKQEALRNQFQDRSVAWYAMDLLDECGTSDAMHQIVLDNPRIDVVVFGPTLPIHHSPIIHSQWNDFESHFTIQVRGMWQIVHALTPQMLSGIKIKFIIILTEYCQGKPPGGISPYVTAKYGLMGLAKTMAVELTRYNCTVNMISPGMVDTTLLSAVPSKLIELTAGQNPLKRIAKPEDIANMVSFLASSQSEYLNGANVMVNGGSVMV